MHFCKANVAIGGDPRNIMNRSEFSPVSWPEIDVLRTIHGGDAVDAVIPFVEVQQSPKAERDRLAMIYGDEPLGVLWGGRTAPSQLNAPEVRQKPDIVWINPLSGQMEKTTANGSEPYTPPADIRIAAEIVGNYAVREAESPSEPEDEMYHDDPADLDPTATETPKKKK